MAFQRARGLGSDDSATLSAQEAAEALRQYRLFNAEKIEAQSLAQAQRDAQTQEMHAQARARAQEEAAQRTLYLSEHPEELQVAGENIAAVNARLQAQQQAYASAQQQAIDRAAAEKEIVYAGGSSMFVENTGAMRVAQEQEKASLEAATVANRARQGFIQNTQEWFLQKVGLYPGLGIEVASAGLLAYYLTGSKKIGVTVAVVPAVVITYILSRMKSF